MVDPPELSREASRYLPLVKSIALDVKKELPPDIDVDDLVGYGTFGLMDALNEFRTRQGTTFKTFAYYRIRGAIYEALPRAGRLSQAELPQHKFRQKANELLQAHSTSAEAGVKRKVEAEAAELKEIMENLIAVSLLSMEAASRMFNYESTHSSQEELLQNQTRENLRAAMRQLDDQERLLVQYYYFDDLTLREVAARLQISLSRALRLHFKSLGKIRTAMQ